MPFPMPPLVPLALPVALDPSLAGTNWVALHFGLAVPRLRRQDKFIGWSSDPSVSATIDLMPGRAGGDMFASAFFMSQANGLWRRQVYANMPDVLVKRLKITP